MTGMWAPLLAELDLWRAAGLVLPLWWRDDDAIADTAALQRLEAIVGAAGLPVHLAVIPGAARPDLAARVRETESIVPLVHGWAHRNHAEPTAKKAEFGDTRPLPDCIDDARAGLDRLTDLFGDRLAAVFVPPWNRMHPHLGAHLRSLGYKAVSTFGTHRVDGIAQVNTHLDPIDWKGSRSLVEPARLVAQIVGDLSHLRASGPQPYGILTHHLVHDAEIWSFCTDLAAVLADGPIHAWDAGKDLT